MPSSAPVWPLDTPMNEMLGRVRARADQMRRRRQLLAAGVMAPVVATVMIVAASLQGAATGSTVRTVPPVDGGDPAGGVVVRDGVGGGGGSAESLRWRVADGGGSAEATAEGAAGDPASPATSPAGDALPSHGAPSGGMAFLRYGAIWVADATGANARKVPGPAKFVSIDLSPDGTEVAAEEVVGNLSRIAIVGLDGSKRYVTELTDNLHRPRWSPDGTKLAVVGDDDMAPPVPVWTVDVATMAISMVDRDGDFPDWSSATGEIVYKCNDRICAIGADGTNRRVLPLGLGYTRPVMSPTGTHLLAQYSGRDGAADKGLVVVRIDGTDRRLVTSATTKGFDWSADGQWVAFAQTAQNATPLCVPGSPVFCELPASIWLQSVDGASRLQATSGHVDSAVSLARALA